MKRLALCVCICYSAALAQVSSAPSSEDISSCSWLAGIYHDNGQITGDVPQLRTSLSRHFAILLGQNPFPLVKKGIRTIVSTEIRYLAPGQLLVIARFPDQSSIEFKSNDLGKLKCLGRSLQAEIVITGHSEGQTFDSTEKFVFSRDDAGGLRMVYDKHVFQRYLFIPSSNDFGGNVVFERYE
jgi:hypothetical protein